MTKRSRIRSQPIMYPMLPRVDEPEARSIPLSPSGLAAWRAPSNVASPTKSRPRKPEPRTAIVAAAVDAATSEDARARLKDGGSLAVVVQVPTAAWVVPVAKYFQTTFGQFETFARDGSNRAAHKPSSGNDEVADALALGGRVLGVSQQPEKLLPAALIESADIHVRIPSLTGTVFRDALRRAYSGRFPMVQDALLADLDLNTIVSAMRVGSRPADVIGRLQAVAGRSGSRAKNGRLPDLEQAIEYGAARDWGLALARDIADYRAGRIAWSEVDRGAVLHSDPGLGKSLFARMLASACRLPLVATSVSEFFASSSGDLDGVIKAQRAVFTQAAEAAPCILFLDEIDAIPDRRTMSPRGRDWWTPVINDFLLLLDAAVAGQREGVIVVGATNMIDHVDPAILRPGRLERSIEICRPDAAGALNIARHHLAGDLSDADLGRFGHLLAGCTGAEIMERVRAARRMARHAQRPLTEGDLLEAIHPHENFSPALLRRMAVHEAAHAVVALHLAIGKVTQCGLPSRAASHGFTRIEFADHDLITVEAVENRVTALLAARAAERAMLGDWSSAAGGSEESDLAHATRYVAGLHVSQGLAGRIAYRCSNAEAANEIRLDPALLNEVEVHLQRLQDRALRLVRDVRAEIEAVAAALADRRLLTGAEIETIAATVRRRPSVSDRHPKGET